MEKVTMYKDKYLGHLFENKEECLWFEHRYEMSEKANEMLFEGKTLGEIQEKTNVFSSYLEDVELAPHLNSITKDHYFEIRSWQSGSSEPLFQIVLIETSRLSEAELRLDNNHTLNIYSYRLLSPKLM